MITDFIITVIFNVVRLIASIFEILPDVQLSTNITGGISSIAPYYQSLDTVIPISTLGAILTFELLFIGAYFTYKLVRWAYQKIPFIN